MKNTNIIFIHRSVGHNLLHDGDVYKIIKDANAPYTLNDYDQNKDILTRSDGKQEKLGLFFPGNDTKPSSYATIFSENITSQFAPILKTALGYDIIVLKSCYPNSHIRTGEELEQIKDRYFLIASFFKAYPDKKLIIVTSPPLVPLRTNSRTAGRARELATWLEMTNFADNIKVFNLFDLLAAPEDDKQANTLRKEYRRWLPTDSHPNVKASQDIAHKFVSFLTKVSEE